MRKFYWIIVLFVCSGLSLCSVNAKDEFVVRDDTSVMTFDVPSEMLHSGDIFYMDLEVFVDGEYHPDGIRNVDLYIFAVFYGEVVEIPIGGKDQSNTWGFAPGLTEIPVFDEFVWSSIFQGTISFYGLICEHNTWNLVMDYAVIHISWE